MIPQSAKVTDDLDRFMRDNDWVMEEKFDGDRMLIVYQDHTVRAFSRTGTECVLPSLFSPVERNKGMTVLDGELMKDGSFQAFDLPYLMDASLRGETFARRRQALVMMLARWNQDEKVELVYQAQTQDEKNALLEHVINSSGEGFMFKRLASNYRFDYRSSDWLKYKLYKTASVIITELQREGKPESIGIGVYDGDTLVEVSGCKLPLCYQNGIDIGDVLEVRYLKFTDDERLREPVFLKKRTDVYPNECTKDKLKMENK